MPMGSKGAGNRMPVTGYPSNPAVGPVVKNVPTQAAGVARSVKSYK